MQTIHSIHSLRKIIRRHKKQGETIGFVPTMGALHEGHLSLIQKCRRENDIVVLSIFVNPAQFLPHEDYKAYPRPIKEDKLVAKKGNVDIIFHPSPEMIYPSGYLTRIEVDCITKILCGRSRPTHFQGVTTIVGKLLNIVNPDVMYLGEKDAQQVVVLKKMVADLNFPVTIKTCPIVREKDGLALSSRNQYLTEKQREKAPILYRSLRLAKDKIRLGEREVKKITQIIRSYISKNCSAEVDYIECVEPNSLAPVKTLIELPSSKQNSLTGVGKEKLNKGKIMIALAAKFGQTRLIDNIVIRIP